MFDSPLAQRAAYAAAEIAEALAITRPKQPPAQPGMAPPADPAGGPPPQTMQGGLAAAAGQPQRPPGPQGPPQGAQPPMGAQRPAMSPLQALPTFKAPPMQAALQAGAGRQGGGSGFAQGGRVDFAALRRGG